MPEGAAYRAHIAIIGGATAGAEAADRLADEGALCVVFEQNDRPYGKVEDGLPAWHAALRKKEYDLIDSKLTSEGVHFIPRTGIGRELSFDQLLNEWNFDLVLLANGAWRDRPLPVSGAETYINRGLVYQNPFIYWFNHHREPGYDGPSYETHDGTAVVGGGLASIDVAKVLQLETTCRKLAERGIDQDLVEMETEGIPATLQQHGLEWKDLGLKGCTLYYRRRLEDMPLAEAPPNATPEQTKKIESVRRRILDKAQRKYLFSVDPLWTPVGLLTHGDMLDGLRFARTRIGDDGKAVIVPGEIQNVEAPLVISSIGSVPMPIKGLPMDGEFLRLDDSEHGRVTTFDNVFGCGNVITGKGNLVASRKHSRQVAEFLADFIGPDAKPRGDYDSLMAHLREQQQAVGYDGRYHEWINRAWAAAHTAASK